MPRPPSVLTPELLKTFVTIVRVDGSVARTSELLDINEASVSKRIKPLHEGSPPTLPLPWLEKHGKTFKLTKEGERMLPAAEDQLSRWEHFAVFVASGRLTQLAVGCGQEAVTGILFDAVKLWRKSYPDHFLRIATTRGQARIEAVAAGLLDLALVSHDRAQIVRYARRPLYIQELPDDPLLLACAPKAPWAKAFEAQPAKVPAANLAIFPMILPEADAGLREQFERKLFAAKQLNKLSIAMEVGGWQAQLAFVREGLGVGLLPASVLSRHGKGLLMKPLAGDLAPEHRLRLICRLKPGTDDPDLSEPAQAFCKVLRDVMRTP